MQWFASTMVSLLQIVCSHIVETPARKSVSSLFPTKPEIYLFFKHIWMYLNLFQYLKDYHIFVFSKVLHIVFLAALLVPLLLIFYSYNMYCFVMLMDTVLWEGVKGLKYYSKI